MSCSSRNMLDVAGVGPANAKTEPGIAASMGVQASVLLQDRCPRYPAALATDLSWFAIRRHRTKARGYLHRTVLPSPTIPADQGHDAITARLLAAGDPDGLRRLLVDHGGRVRGALQRAFADALDASSIDEALSQASQRAWRAGARFDPARGSLRAWFYVIALNCARRLLAPSSIASMA